MTATPTTQQGSNPGPSLQRFAWASIAAAALTIGLKTLAWHMTGSVGLLSDAIESVVNLAAAIMALWMLWLAERPANERHPHGHTKAEYFSSAFEGFLILWAALSIGYAAIRQLLNPQALEDVGVGLLVSALASGINLLVARWLFKAGKEHRSITLQADAHHLMTDVWTSVGVVIGVALVAATGWAWLDPIIALAVAVNIVRTGLQLMQQSASGLMDAAMPYEDVQRIRTLLDSHATDGITYHALRTRQAGRRSFVSVHLLMPGAWTVQHAHDWAEQIEGQLRTAIPGCHVSTHIEPVEDPRSLTDDDMS